MYSQYCFSFLFDSTITEADFPLQKLSSEGPAPSEELDEVATNDIAKYYLADVQSYVGEDCSGAVLASIGELPAIIEGMDPDAVASVAANPDSGSGSFETSGSPSDSPTQDPLSLAPTADPLGIPSPTPDPLSSLVPSSDPLSPTEDEGDILTPSPYDGTWNATEQESVQGTWDALKENFTDIYGAHMQALADDAREEWDDDRFDRENGQVLLVNEDYAMPLLHSLKSFKLSGEGVTRCDVEAVSRNSKIVLTALSNIQDENLPLMLKIEYTNGVTEAKNFTIASQDSINDLNNDEDSSRVRDLQEVYWADGAHHNRKLQTQVNYWWAANGQRAYSASRACTNLRSYGATAWGNLFGWADFRASVAGSGWNSRWGIYRRYGGPWWSPNVVAPYSMDFGVRNMIREIHLRTRSFCAYTLPGYMWRARRYLSSRSPLVKLVSLWNGLLIPNPAYRVAAANSIIRSRTPAVIATGSSINSYGLAWGYQRRRTRRCILWGRVCWWKTNQRLFYVNRGNGTPYGGWINARTWYYGTIRP